MKARSILIVGLLTLIYFSSCKEKKVDFECEDFEHMSYTKDNDQQVYFQFDQFNYGAFYIHNGFYIDSAGRCYFSNDLPFTYEGWELPDSSGFISKENMSTNIGYFDTVCVTLSREELLSKTDIIRDASNGTIYEGLRNLTYISYSAYIYNSVYQRYEQVLLYSFNGETESLNSSCAAIEIYNWMDSLFNEVAYD